MAKNIKIGVKMKVLRGPRTSEVGVVVVQIGFGRKDGHFASWTTRLLTFTKGCSSEQLL